jgi:hypothetical protein
MPLPSSGSISLNQVNVELGRSGTQTISMNDSAVRTLFGVGASGVISMSQGYGKANEFTFAIASSQVNANLRTLAVNAGWNGVSKVIATINSGVWVYANTTGAAGLTINGSFPNGVELINNGAIAGMGGNGGNGAPGTGSGNTGAAGAGGGTALSVGVAVSIRNNNTIAGGGGGGGGGGAISTDQYSPQYGGGGGGGGQTGLANSGGGAGGYVAGAGGAGTTSGPGGGGAGGNSNYNSGGSGGGWGAAGGSGVGADGPGGGGGGGGASVTGSSLVTWLATGSRFGPVL